MSAWTTKSESIFLSRSVQIAKTRNKQKTFFSGFYVHDDLLRCIIQFLEPHEYFPLLTINLDFYDLIRNHCKSVFLEFMKKYNKLSKNYSYLLFLKTICYDKKLINDFEICLKEKEAENTLTSRKVFCSFAQRYVVIFDPPPKKANMSVFCALLKIINYNNIDYVKFCKIHKINQKNIHISFPIEKPLLFKENLNFYLKYINANLLKSKIKK